MNVAVKDQAKQTQGLCLIVHVQTVIVAIGFAMNVNKKPSKKKKIAGIKPMRRLAERGWAAHRLFMGGMMVHKEETKKLKRECNDIGKQTDVELLYALLEKLNELLNIAKRENATSYAFTCLQRLRAVEQRLMALDQIPF